MIFFPNAKINLGLDVIERREDGFHNIESVMIPVRGLCDILEITKSGREGIELICTGIETGCRPESNLVTKAYNLMAQRHGIGGVKMQLHKIIPTQAGLGGGSADATYAIRGLNQIFELGLGAEQMEELAAELGSDTPFFVRNRPQLAKGRGELLTPAPQAIIERLKGKRLVIIKPDAVVSTAEAYAGITPYRPTTPLTERLTREIKQWRIEVVNNFEPHIIETHPVIGEIKETLYELGAEYASMSGAGTAVYGLFEVSDPQDFFHFSTPLHTPLKDMLTKKLKKHFPQLSIHQEIIA